MDKRDVIAAITLRRAHCVSTQMAGELSLCTFSSTVRLEKLIANVKQHQIFSCENTKVCLCRNTYGGICIQLRPPKNNKKYVYLLENFRSSTKYIKEGKFTITLLNDQILILFSNAPPAKLTIFMKTLHIKKTIGNEKLSNNSFSSTESVSSISNEVNFVKHMIATNSIQKISPLTNNEIKKFNELFHSKIKNNTNFNGTKMDEYEKRVYDEIAASPMKYNKIKKEIKIDHFNLNEEQKKVLNVILSGKSVFITGGAGTGKSYLMKCLIAHLPPSTTFVTASTGIAASQINGTTIHSFAGIGTGEQCLDRCIDMASRKPYKEFWKRCQCLVIDEISMISANYFSKLESVARAIKNSSQPFGGIQLILCGDFYQLAPVNVNTYNQSKLTSSNSSNYCFAVDCWNKCIDCCFELKTIHRQKNDAKFSSFLNYLRIGLCNEAMENLINKTIFNTFSDGIVPTNLCTHKADAFSINQKHLEELPGNEKSFLAIDNPIDSSSILNSHMIVPAKISLKIGARVMLCCNLSVSSGLTNGSTGDVKRFDTTTGYPIVYFNMAKKEVLIKPEKFTIKKNQNCHCERIQIPLTLAWALSIHKSQGLTLDAVQVSLSKVFTYGQVYVALSRAQSLKQLRVVGFSKKNIQVDSSVKNFYKSISFD